jgi:hypothetical protein
VFRVVDMAPGAESPMHRTVSLSRSDRLRYSSWNRSQSTMGSFSKVKSS